MREKNGATFFNKWWKVGGAIMALIVAWTTLQISVNANTGSLDRISEELDARQVRITTNEAKISNVEMDIKEIKGDLKEILRELRK